MSLVLQGVTFGYEGMPILTGVDLSCDEGMTVAVCGPSGVGKTTVLNIAAGILSPWSGSASFDGLSPVEAAKEQRIAYVFQTPTLLPYLTVAENVAIPLYLRQRRIGTAPKWGLLRSLSRCSEVVEALAIARIGHAADMRPPSLSGGMQYRASLARALSYRPRLLLLDEPFSALDDVAKEALYTELQEVQANFRMATILVTHDLIQACLLSDRVSILRPVGIDGSPPCSVIHTERITLPRPRTMSVLGNQEFLASLADVRRFAAGVRGLS